MAKSRAKFVAEFADNIESAGGVFPAGGGVTSYSMHELEIYAA